MDLGLGGKVAIVTGGSVGIGRETARKLAAEGVSVVITARSRDALEQAATRISAETGGTCIAIPADMTDTTAVQACVNQTVERFGSVDILVNCAAAPGGLVRNISSWRISRR